MLIDNKISWSSQGKEGLYDRHLTKKKELKKKKNILKGAKGKNPRLSWALFISIGWTNSKWLNGCFSFSLFHVICRHEAHLCLRRKKIYKTWHLRFPLERSFFQRKKIIPSWLFRCTVASLWEGLSAVPKVTPFQRAAPRWSHRVPATRFCYNIIHPHLLS